jgi:3-hydroxyacyl-CoA dehydrogenase
MDGAQRIAAAKERALALANAGYAPPAAAPVPVMGRAGVALIETVLYNLEAAGRASAHDRKVGRELARVLAGGDVPGPTTISARHLLDLEREAFLRLLGERKTLERIQSLLKTGKPLRN